MGKKLSATMAVALAECIEHGGELVRWQGGFWTYPNCAVAHERKDYRVPAWYVGTETVRALATRGYLEATERLPTSSLVIRMRVIEAALLAA